MTLALSADEVRAALTDAHRAVLGAIVAAPLAWTAAARLADRFDEATIAALEVLDLVVRWPLPTEDVITLTEWGQFVLRVELDERFESISGCHVEVPFWVLLGKGSDAVVLPRYPREVRMPFPDKLPDRRPAPALLVDEVSGEPVTLLGGYTVRIDPKLKGAGGHPHPKAHAIDAYLYRSPR